MSPNATDHFQEGLIVPPTRLYREGSPGALARYMSLYAGDVFTHDRLSINAGVRFDLALIDLGLPDGSGTEVVAALR